MKLIVGLGNIGSRYAETRHNAGFMVVQQLAERHGLTTAKGRFHASVVEGMIGSEKVMLMLPTTLMNRSGLAVGEATRFHRLELSQLMIVVDDTALPAGTFRIKPSGGAGGHNGLTDVERALGGDTYPRLRVGIDAPIVNDRRIVLSDYVLSPFTDEQRMLLKPAIARACDALECWITHGLDTAMNRFNPRTPNPQPPDLSSHKAATVGRAPPAPPAPNPRNSDSPHE